MKVLLISPKDPKISTDLKFLMGGENTYTNSLLSYPPQGVHYTHHSEALQRGEIEYTFWQTALSVLIKTRIFPIDSGYQCLRLKKKFDLVHCHGYSLKLDGKIRPPVILGDSSSNFLFLRDYLNWSEARIRTQYKLRALVHKYFNVYDRDLHLGSCAKLIVFSQFAKRVHLDLGADPQKVVVVPPGLPQVTSKKKQSPLVNILFAGVWFERKGGMVVIEAFRKLAPKYKNIRLTLLGPLPEDVFIKKGERIEQKDFVPYEELLDYYAKTDIFVLVPPKAEGYGLVIEEAMSFGIPAVVSDIYALPEMAVDKETGFVVRPGSVEDLAAKLEILIKDSKMRQTMGKLAQKRFMEKFWIEKTNQQLLKVYREALPAS